jgi:transcription elongation regulator 1
MPPAPGGYQQPHQPQQQQQPHLAPVNEIDASTDEVWVETKAGDGKSYYYHAKTRETTWTKPEGPNVKVLTQQQVIRIVYIFFPNLNQNLSVL